MPKLKTKSGAKKRFRTTATGKIRVQKVGKRHGMIKRTPKFIRQSRSGATLGSSDAKVVRRFMPYG